MPSISPSVNANKASYCVHSDSLCGKLRFVSCGSCDDRRLSEEMSSEYIDYQMGLNRDWKPPTLNGGKQNSLSDWLAMGFLF